MIEDIGKNSASTWYASWWYQPIFGVFIKKNIFQNVPYITRTPYGVDKRLTPDIDSSLSCKCSHRCHSSKACDSFVVINPTDCSSASLKFQKKLSKKIEAAYSNRSQNMYFSTDCLKFKHILQHAVFLANDGHSSVAEFLTLIIIPEGHSMWNEQIFRKVVIEGSSNFLKKNTLKGI